MPKAKIIRPDIDWWKPNVDKYFVYVDDPTRENLERILADFEIRFERSFFQRLVKPFLSHILGYLPRSYDGTSPEILEDMRCDLQDTHIMLFEACVKLSRGCPWKLDDENPVDS
jgi:hypothetical protein